MWKAIYTLLVLLVPAYPGCPGQTAVKWLLLLFHVEGKATIHRLMTNSKVK